MNRISASPLTWPLSVAAALLLAGGCVASRGPSTGVDPAARAEIDRMCAAMSGLSAYRMKVASVTDEVLPSGRQVEVGRMTEIKVSKPDRLAMTVVRDNGHSWAFWLSGQQGVLLDVSGKRYARLNLPPDIDMALEALEIRHGLDLPLADLVSSPRRADLMSRVQSGVYVGEATIAGRACHHVLFRQPGANWQAWVETADPALPRRILIQFKDDPGMPAYQATMVEWDTAPKFDESTWAPKLPDGAREVTAAALLGEE